MLVKFCFSVSFFFFLFFLRGRASALVVINLCKIYQILEVKNNMEVPSDMCV